MLSDELNARVRAALERSRDRELNFQRMLPMTHCCCGKNFKPRIRIKAISQRRSLPVTSETGIAGE